jgi:hypothetical protein
MVFVSQFSPQYLADIALREFRPELDVFRPLYGVNCVPAKPIMSWAVRCGSTRTTNILTASVDFASGMPIAGAFQDSRMAGDHLFDLVWIDELHPVPKTPS